MRLFIQRILALLELRVFCASFIRRVERFVL
jgi:hypothetical protein